MRSLFGAVAVVLAPLAAAAAQAPGDSARPISLDEAVRLAQRNAPAAVQARGQLTTSRAGVKAAYSAFYPSVNVSLGASYDPNAEASVINDRLVPGAKWRGTQSLSLNVDLFDGGRRFFDLRAARANVDAAEATEVAQRFSVALNVQQAFFNALAARESEAAARAQLQQAEQQLRAANSRVAAGVATKSDSLRSVIQVGNAQLAMLTAQNNLRAANATLTRLVATSFTVTANPSDTLFRPGALPDSAELARIAEQGPAVVQASAVRTAARAVERASRTPYLPSVTVSYRRQANGPDLRFGFDTAYRYTSSLQFGLSYQLFNQFGREQARVRAEVAADNADAALRDAQLAAQQELAQNLGALRTAEQRIAIQSASVAAAEEDLRVQQQRYALGASTLLEVLTTQTSLNTARAALIQARYDYRVAKAQLEALIGRQL